MKKLLKRALGEKVLGIIDYYRFPNLKAAWGGALNGQKHRQKMVEGFLRMPLDAIVETGTYRGTTTAYLAVLSALPIYTVEFSPRFQAYSWLALRKFQNVHRFKGDSRHFLRTLATNELLCGKMILFYLDAHWNADLPLAEELEIIFGHWKEAVVLIDDFQVPDDPGYGYDDYGLGSALTMDYIDTACKKFGLYAFLPSVSSTQETGAKRGSVTLVSDTNLREILVKMSEVREYELDFAPAIKANVPANR